MQQRLVADHVPVDPPIPKRLAVDLPSSVVENILSARVDRAAIALFDALAVNAVVATAAGVLLSATILLSPPS